MRLKRFNPGSAWLLSVSFTTSCAVAIHSQPTGLIGRVLDAYGGAARWRAAVTVEAVVSTRGLLFKAKRQPPFDRMRASVEVHAPRARLAPREWDGKTGVLDGRDVWLETPSGRVISTREDARRWFHGIRRGLRRALYWDRLDLTYFGGYALWNYLAFPALLLRDDVKWRELGPDLLEATFPSSLPTHCAVQKFHISSATGQLVRHDYTAEVIGRWARAAHAILAHEQWEGLVYPSHRRVTPLGPGSRALPGPTLVEIVVHEWALVAASPRLR